MSNRKTRDTPKAARLRELRDEFGRMAVRMNALRVELESLDAGTGEDAMREATALLSLLRADNALEAETGVHRKITPADARTLGAALVEAADALEKPLPGPAVQLVRAPHDDYQAGQVTYRVLVDGRNVGLVGDGRPWRGHRYGARKWWACWREDGDTAARWNTDLDQASRKAAVDALLRQLDAEGQAPTHSARRNAASRSLVAAGPRLS